MGWGLSINEKNILGGFETCDVHERITLATIMQKDVFDNNVWTKALGTKIFDV